MFWVSGRPPADMLSRGRASRYTQATDCVVSLTSTPSQRRQVADRFFSSVFLASALKAPSGWMTSTSGMARPSLFVEFRWLWSGEPGAPHRFRPVAEGAGLSTENLGHVGAHVVLPAVADEGEELTDVGGVVGRDPHADRRRFPVGGWNVGEADLPARHLAGRLGGLRPGH